jgi:SOS response regulatory protein OraA/RecX
MSNEEQEEDRQATIRQLVSKGYSLEEATRILEEHPKDRIGDYRWSVFLPFR